MENNIDAVYILGEGSRWSNNEIRYSIRSLERNFKFRNIVVIGECPEWLHGITYIPIKDSKSNVSGIKLQNARQKYLTACNDQRISKDFMLMNDDFFFLEEVSEIRNYSRGTIEEMMSRHPTKAGYYYHSLRDTDNKLKAMGIEKPIDFEIHGPMIFNKSDLLNVIGMVGMDRYYSFRSCYGNLMNLKSEVVIDFKAANLAEFAYQTSRNREFLSINDALVASEEFRTWIHRMFPKPSRYEIDKGDGVKAQPGRPLMALKYTATKTFVYGKNTYSPGDIIDNATIQLLKRIPKMRDMWTIK